MNVVWSQMQSFEVSAVLFQEEGKWIIQGLQYDICAQGESVEEATNAFDLAFVANVCASIHVNGEPLKGIDAAPAKYWDMFRESRISVDAPQEPVRVTSASSVPRVKPKLKLYERQVAA